MKSYLPIVLSSILLFTGCGLLPKRVELFQKKVQAFPEQSATYSEVQKRAAQLAKDRAQQTLIAAVQEKSSTNVVSPAADTAQLSDAVSTSLGPPKYPAGTNDSANALADELRTQIAKLDRKIDSYKEANEKVEGKKIEGTGLISVPYFVWAGGFVLIVVVGWHLAKIALSAASVANPGFGIAVGGMNVASGVAGKAITQIVAGGKDFMSWVGSKEAALDPAIQAKITEAFTTAHKLNQDSDVQAIVKPLTK